MPLPPDVDAQIRKRFDDLATDADDLAPRMEREDVQIRQAGAARGMSIAVPLPVQIADFAALQTRTVSLLEFLLPGAPHLKRLIDEIAGLNSFHGNGRRLQGIIRGLKNDYETGMLNRLPQLIEAKFAADYMGQAEQLLGEGIRGHFDHVPAAVLSGAILEDSLRRLCARQSPPIDVNKPNGEPKTLGTLIDDLKAAALYNELTAKQLRAWAAIRNAAAHGKFDEFTREQVESFLKDLQDFLTRYL